MAPKAGNSHGFSPVLFSGEVRFVGRSCESTPRDFSELLALWRKIWSNVRMASRISYKSRKRKTVRIRENSAGSAYLGTSGPINCVLCGDAALELKKLPADYVDLIFTSPPCAECRKKTYGGIHPDQYAGWLLPITSELLRVLKPTGSFVLNIKEKTFRGERHTYVIDTILGMRRQRWLWTEEYIWHKRNCYPGKWPNRFRDAWERCLHFTSHRTFAMNQEGVRFPRNPERPSSWN